MPIFIDDLNGPEIKALLIEHLDSISGTAPAESQHALDIDSLRQPDITFWSLWRRGQLAGCIALKRINAQHAEIKSMRTATAFLKTGVATQLIQHLIDDARMKGYQKLSLETGSMAYFLPARQLYEKFGFEYCAPFAEYKEDPNSVFMRKDLTT